MSVELLHDAHNNNTLKTRISLSHYKHEQMCKRIRSVSGMKENTGFSLVHGKESKSNFPISRFKAEESYGGDVVL